VADFGYQIAQALSRAHRKNLLHRDLKPANVIVTPDGEVKVLDFGLATLFERSDTVAPSEATTRLDDDGPGRAGLAGTLPYMSPEQARMETLDARSDIFSLGTMLYEMTTGQLPFTSPTGVEVIQAVQRARPRPVHDLLPQVPLELDRIVQKAMAPRRGDRYQAVQDLAVDLKRLGKELESGSSPSYEALQGLTDQSVRRAPRWVIPTLLVLVVVVVALALTVFWPWRGLEEPTSTAEAILAAQTEVASIAVLPFADMSPGKDQEYFAEGLSEELLNALVRIRDLRVAARTSSFSFKGKNVTIAEIGQALNVATVLEGSVRKAGNRVRITAQLVSVEDGFHLWSETYDRELSDIFKVQDEIARSVAGELQVRLVGDQQESLASSSSRVDPAAYSAYLQGQYFADLDTEADLWKAVGYFEEALNIAPDFRSAWLGLAHAHAVLIANFVPVELGLAKARKALERALELDDTHADAYALLSLLKMQYEWDWTGADAAIQRAIELEPGNANALNKAAKLAAAMGRLEESIALDRRVAQLDPRGVLFWHGLRAQRAGLPEQALAASKRAVDLAEGPIVRSIARTCLGLVYLDQGRAEAALAEFERVADPARRVYGLALAYHALGRQDAADSALAELIEEWGDIAAFQIADVYAFRGDPDRAFEWLERAYDQRDGGLAALRVIPGFQTLYDDPRWKRFLKKMGLPE
jgi:serine/threonine-protein kinase